MQYSNNYDIVHMSSHIAGDWWCRDRKDKCCQSRENDLCR